MPIAMDSRIGLRSCGSDFVYELSIGGCSDLWSRLGAGNES